MTSRLFRILVLLVVSSFVVGCKLTVMVPFGGDVTATSASGTQVCSSGQVCEFIIGDTTFSQAFNATARPGYQFVRWQKGTGFFCGDSTNPTCSIALSGNSVIDEAIIASFEIGYVVPIFKDVGLDLDGDGIRNELDEDDDNDGIKDGDDTCPQDPNPICIPITDTVVANGKEWAQVDLFEGHSLEEILTVCPAGACAGTVNGYNLSGWIWATSADVQDLYQYYDGVAACSVDGFIADGWRIHDYGAVISIEGWVYEGAIGIGRAGPSCFTPTDSSSSPNNGAWFYRAP